MSCENRFRQQLRERGLRLTAQREQVLGALHQFSAPATVEEIQARLCAQQHTVNRSTIYRTLELFLDFELIDAFDANDGVRRYERLGGTAPHCHLICRHCGQVISVPLEALQPCFTYLAATYHFTLDLVGADFSGLCAACQSNVT